MTSNPATADRLRPPLIARSLNKPTDTAANMDEHGERTQ